MTKRMLLALLLALPTIGAISPVAANDPMPTCLPCPPPPPPVATSTLPAL